MIANILFFIVWTVVLFWFATTRARKAIEIIKNQEEQIEKAKEVFEKNEKIFEENNKRYLERAVHIDTLLKELKMYQDDLNILENFSGLLGKQYLFKQDDGTYYNRYTEEYMTAEEATDWLYVVLMFSATAAAAYFLV